MKKKILYILSILCFFACKETELDFTTELGAAVELTGVEASVYSGNSTRSAALDKENHVGRNVFVDKDQMVLTTIKRTAQPSASPAVTSIPGFSYHGIVFNHVVGSGQTSGGWTRDELKGSTEAGGGVPEKIYWSDADNWHTYIGYSVPQQATGVTFDWKNTIVYSNGPESTGVDTYYGSLGDPTIVQSLDEDGNVVNYIDHTTKENIDYDDLLLTYDDEKVAETGGSVAKLYFHHALANVRVIVSISGFSATSESADARSKVENMVLKNMLTMYKWRQMSNGAQALESQYDPLALEHVYVNQPVPAWNQKKDTHLWIPRPDGTGKGVGKQFVFYGLAVPTIMDANSLNLEFTVQYQDPMEPWLDSDEETPNMKAHTYRARMSQAIEFRAGWCTTINISLNHNNEDMTVGAEYMEWQFIDTPDEGELKKNTTFMAHTDRNKITIFGDDNATIDDATWLYIDEENENKLRDIYGHYGTPNDPFVISTAEQLLSFAYEVKGNNRRADLKYNNIITSNQEAVLPTSGSFDFTGYYVKLDADITMQKSSSEKDITWIGIGAEGKPFNGVFLGSSRRINNLYGEHFFHTVGLNAVIDKLNFDKVIEVQGCGVIAHKNQGLICSCFIDGDVKETNFSSQFTGSIVGENDSFIIACAHVGKVSGYNTVGGLVGFNNGTVMASYHAGEITGLGPNPEVHATVGKRGDGENETNKSIMFSCYYDNNLIYHTPILEPGRSGFPLSTSVMQSNAFVNSGNTYNYNESSLISKEGKTLREILIEDLFDISDDPELTEQELIIKLEREGCSVAPTIDINFLFNNYHFSLNEALQVFRYWLNAIPSDQNVSTNCHVFTPEQISFLKDHYSVEHKFVYTPASYPKVQ